MLEPFKPFVFCRCGFFCGLNVFICKAHNASESPRLTMMRGTVHISVGFAPTLGKWLVRDGNGGLFPIMGNDVWEHAYYLKYNDRRGDYLKTW